MLWEPLASARFSMEDVMILIPIAGENYVYSVRTVLARVYQLGEEGNRCIQSQAGHAL